jgi:D-serine deaminase-like pyridoxal phosphate-dependent protein
MSPGDNGGNWYLLADAAALPSPALLVYPQRVKENIRRMLALAGGPERLRPHIKTHKMPDLVKLQLDLGITKFKCATVAEAEMAAQRGARDLLLAYQPVGPAVKRVVELLGRFPQVHFSIIADDAAVVRELSRAVQQARPQSKANQEPATVEVLIDVDIGQHRTGIPPGARAIELYRLIESLPGLKTGGLHAYDGHLSEPDPILRRIACEEGFAPVKTLRDQLEKAGLQVPRVVVGGTPTFPFHAKRGDVECSPGTCVFWDAGYSNKLRDLDFLPAALVLTRVVSKPENQRLCLDLGHKAVAAEMPHPRVVFLNLGDAQALAHSEEHLVVETSRSAEFKIGDCLYGLPWHICPTVALHSEAMVVEHGHIVGVWKVTARERRLTI